MKDKLISESFLKVSKPNESLHGSHSYPDLLPRLNVTPYKHGEFAARGWRIKRAGLRLPVLLYIVFVV